MESGLRLVHAVRPYRKAGALVLTYREARLVAEDVVSDACGRSEQALRAPQEHQNLANLIRLRLSVEQRLENLGGGIEGRLNGLAKCRMVRVVHRKHPSMLIKVPAHICDDVLGRDNAVEVFADERLQQPSAL